MERQAVTKVQKTLARANHLQTQSAQSSPAANPLLELQRSIGNQAIQRLISSPSIQAKLQVSTPGDPYEQEADRVADTVMRMPEPEATQEKAQRIQAKPLTTRITPLVRRAPEEPSEEDEEQIVATKPILQRAVPLAVREDDDEEKVAPKLIQRMCTECEKQPEEDQAGGMVHKKSVSEQLPDDDELQGQSVQLKGGHTQAPQVTPSVAANIHAMNGGGSPMSNSSRAFFEPRFGADFSQVRVHTDSRAAETAKSINARAFTVGRNIAFGGGQFAPDSQDGRRLLAHELTHVVQQNGGQLQESVRRSPGPDPTGGTKTKQTGTSTLAQPPIEWAGVGETGKVFETSSHDTFVDPAWKESVEISTDWTMAEFKSYEFKTDAVLEVARTIKMRDALGQSILIRSRGRTFFFADKLPNDVHAAVYAPARLIMHDGVIQITAGDTIKAMQTMDHKLARWSSLAEMLNSEPMVGFDVLPKDRLAQFGKFTRATLPGFERNLLLLESIGMNARRAKAEIQEYIRQKLDYRTPNEDLLLSAELIITSIRELKTYSWTGYETSDLYYWLDEVSGRLAGLLSYARMVKPKDKDVWDHALDLFKAVGKALYGLVIAVKELGAMARDLTMKGLDKIANVFGYELEWKAWSAVGKAYEQGKSTKEIFTAVVDGFVDAWKVAIDKAGNGDYSGLMDLGAELTLDIALEVITVGAATPAVAAKRTGTMAARMASFTKDAAEAIATRSKDLIRKSKDFIEKVPAAARRKLESAMDSLEGLAYALKHEVVPEGAGRLALDLNTIPQAIARVKGERAMKAAGRAVEKLPGGTRRIGQSVLQRLDDLATKMPNAVHSLAARIAKPGGDKLVKALDRALPSIKKLDDDVAAATLRRAADAVDPVAYLDNVNWVMKHDGIKVAARKELVRHAVMRDKPLDLAWLRNTELDDMTLQFLATDPATNWTAFMKVSSKPSDYFPASLRKKLKKSDYVDAGAKLRGVAGELSFVVNTKNLPAGFRIEARQIPASGKVIDFKLLDAAGNPAMLEVKAWNAKRWTKEIDANLGKSKGKLSGGTKSMIEQLQAAKKVPPGKGKKMTVYLAVSDVIDAADEIRLGNLLRSHGLHDVIIHKFPESSLTATRNKLRDAMGLPAAGAAATALVTADTVADYAEGRDE